MSKKNFLHNLPVKHKILFGFGFLLVLSLFAGIFSLVQTQRVTQFSIQIAEQWMPSVAEIGEIGQNITSFRATEYELIQSEKKAEMKELLEGSSNSLLIYFKNYEPKLQTPEEKDSFKALTDNWTEYLKLHTNFLSKLEAGDVKAASAILTQSRPIYEKILENVVFLSEQSFNGGVLAGQKASSVNAQSKVASTVTLLIILLFGVSCSVLLSRNINRVLGDVLQGISGVSSGLNNSSVRLAQTSERIANDATSSAASVQETASALEEVSSMVTRSAEYATNSEKVSLECQRSAEEGQRVVSDMIQSMREIEGTTESFVGQVKEGNQKISEIVKVISEIGNKTKVINDIVFQTKLLSFNASVEAARAGEHGKGFAVVAEEVGSLAQMSGNAAREISTLLDQSIQQVQNIVDETRTGIDRTVEVSKEKVQVGAKTAERCGEVLNSIVSSVRESAKMNREIASASQEQSKGVSEITKAISQLDQAIQSNSAASQDASSLANELLERSETLGNYVSRLSAVIQGNTKSHPPVLEQTALTDPAKPSVQNQKEKRAA